MNNKFLKLVSVTLIITLVGSVFLVIYMKHSNNCALLGATVQSWVEKSVCQAELPATPQDTPTIPLTPLPDETPPTANSAADVDPHAADVVQSNGDTNINLDSQSDNEMPPSSTPIVESSVNSATGAVSAPNHDNAAVVVEPSPEQLIGGSNPEVNSQLVIEPSTSIDLTDTSASTAVSTSATTIPGSTVHVQGDVSTQSDLPVPAPIYETPALLVAENKLKITSLIQGKIKSLAYKEGQSFNKDDILVTFDCKSIELDLDIQRADLKDKEESFKDLTKLKELKSTSTYSLVRAQSQVEQTRKLIEKYEYQLSTCIIKAEYAGKVISKQANENQYVQAGQEIMTVNNNSELLVKAYVPVSWLDWLKAGTSFELCFDKDNCHKGVVNRVGAEVDAISQTLDIFGRLTSEKNSNLIAGLSGQVKFEKS